MEARPFEVAENDSHPTIFGLIESPGDQGHLGQRGVNIGGRSASSDSQRRL